MIASIEMWKRKPEVRNINRICIRPTAINIVISAVFSDNKQRTSYLLLFS